MKPEDPFVQRIGSNDWDRIKKEAVSAEYDLSKVVAPDLAKIPNPYLTKALIGEADQADIAVEE